MRKTSNYRKSTLSLDAKWKLINWFNINRYVERLQRRIYRAECLGNKRKVRNLQRLLVRSKAMMLISIKRVTQINKGKKTAGVDGEIALNNEDRLKLFYDLNRNGKQDSNQYHMVLDPREGVMMLLEEYLCHVIAVVKRDGFLKEISRDVLTI